jgi:diguanylate cyclase (GGDEF)-like protein
MRRTPIPSSEEEETGRETRLKLILLAVALALVAGYASMVTTMDNFLIAQVSGILKSDILPLAIGLGGAVVAFCGLGYLAIRRGTLGRLLGKSAMSAEATMKLRGRQEFLNALGGQIEAHIKDARQLAIHLIDIDRFRAMNELLGEAEADAFLKLVGERLMILVDRPERLARIGDDEFAILQPEAGGARHAEIYVRRIEEALKDCFAQVPQHARPAASIGIALAPDHGESPIKLLHSASLALGAAKQAGGGTFRVYSPELERSVESRLEIERAIGEGLHQGWFDIHFQPQYDLGTRRLTGFEALARMHHPKLGEVSPEVFVPVADQSGLINPLGEWIIHQAVSTAATWPHPITLSINISLAQFRNGDVAGTILHALSNSDFEASRLRVEASEAVLLEDSRPINEQLKRLKTRGVSIVLDDFGLDVSRLKLLSRSACDAVKLDRSLVLQVGEAPEMEVLIRSLIGTAQSFHLDILAEGVESAEQAQFLMSNDCNKVQGFLFGRPTAAQDLAAIIAKDTRNALGETPGRPTKSSSAAA